MHVHLDTGTDRMRVRVLGHPPPMVLRNGVVEEIPASPQPPLGVFPMDTEAEPDAFSLPEGSSVLFYTDGLVDAYDDGPPERLEVEGLRNLVARVLDQGVSLNHLPEYVVDEAERSNGGPLQDDVAMLLVKHSDPQ